MISTETIDKHAEHGGQNEHRGETEFPPRKPDKAGPHHVAGVIESLIATVLPVEAGLVYDPQRHAGDGRHDRGARDRGRDLRCGHHPETLREQV